MKKDIVITIKNDLGYTICIGSEIATNREPTKVLTDYLEENYITLENGDKIQIEIKDNLSI